MALCQLMRQGGIVVSSDASGIDPFTHVKSHSDTVEATETTIVRLPLKISYVMSYFLFAVGSQSKNRLQLLVCMST
jgi:hypothetical protein